MLHMIWNPYFMSCFSSLPISRAPMGTMQILSSMETLKHASIPQSWDTGSAWMTFLPWGTWSLVIWLATLSHMFFITSCPTSTHYDHTLLPSGLLYFCKDWPPWLVTGLLSWKLQPAKTLSRSSRWCSWIKHWSMRQGKPPAFESVCILVSSLLPKMVGMQ